MNAATPSDSNFKKIREDFSLLEDWEDRYRYLIDLGGDLEPLPDAERTDRNKVRGCASQVWLWTQVPPVPDADPKNQASQCKVNFLDKPPLDFSSCTFGS